jgi:hypothetical protein
MTLGALRFLPPLVALRFPAETLRATEEDRYMIQAVP